MTSTHTRVKIPLSSRACEVSCRVRVGEATRPASSRRTTPASPQGAASDSSPISVDRWVPRLHPLVGLSPAYWMELGAIGEGRDAISVVLANLRRTVAGSVDRVTSCETRRFPHGHLRKPQEDQGFTQVIRRDIGAVSGPLSFRYVSYLTVSTAGERRQAHRSCCRARNAVGLVADGDAIAQIRAPVQHGCKSSTRDGEPLNQLGHRGARSQYHRLRFGTGGRARGGEVADRDGIPSISARAWLIGLATDRAHRPVGLDEVWGH